VVKIAAKNVIQRFHVDIIYDLSFSTILKFKSYIEHNKCYINTSLFSLTSILQCWRPTWGNWIRMSHSFALRKNREVNIIKQGIYCIYLKQMTLLAYHRTERSWYHISPNKQFIKIVKKNYLPNKQVGEVSGKDAPSDPFRLITTMLANSILYLISVIIEKWDDLRF